jgi:hypothetical protein
MIIWMEASGQICHINGRDEELVENFGRNTLKEKVGREPERTESISRKGPLAGSCKHREEFSYST